jgi:hypothetical protein
MWWLPLVSVVTGAMQDKERERMARLNAASDMEMEVARRLDPGMSDAPYRAAKLDAALGAQRGESAQRLLGAALQAYGGSLDSGGGAAAGGGAPGRGASLQAPSLVSGDYGAGYGFGRPPDMGEAGLGSSFDLREPRLLNDDYGIYSRRYF